MGDGYASGEVGRHDQGGGTHDPGPKNAGLPRQTRRTDTGLKPKDLIGMPWRLAFALQDDGWWLRSEIIWAKPNPMPESVTDRPTKSHEQIFLLTKSPRYFYDADAIREPLDRPELLGKTRLSGVLGLEGQRGDVGRQHDYGNPAGRNARTVWTIATFAYPAAHFATYPPELPRRCILAGTSERGVCPQCGAPWTRVVEREAVPDRTVRLRAKISDAEWKDGWEGVMRGNINVTTTGWQPSCTHGLDQIPATVLDPFAGSGTTIMVALQLNRSAIGIELSPTYADLARRRILDDHGAVVPLNGHTPDGMAAVQGRMPL
jgi:hypothetical protein